MEGLIEVGKGQEICNLLLSKHCRGHHRQPSVCYLFGEEVQACQACLRKLYEEEHSEEFEWTLKEVNHVHLHETISVDFGIGRDQVTFCRECLIEVILVDDPRALDWTLADIHNDTHGEPLPGVVGKGSLAITDEQLPRACRECLLIALARIDYNFFELVVSVQGMGLLGRLERN